MALHNMQQACFKIELLVVKTLDKKKFKYKTSQNWVIIQLKNDSHFAFKYLGDI